MAVVPVTEWAPDTADLGNPGSVSIVNAVPGTTSYKPMASHVPFTDALDAYARGAIDARDKAGNVLQYAGNETKIYELTTATWGDVSIGGGYSTSTEEHWEFIRWKNQVIATNWDENPQFLELGGANFANLTTDFRCRSLAVVGDFVVAANTNDAGDGDVPDRIRWSAISDETDWTVSPVTGADIRDLKEGAILCVFGGEYGVICGEKNIWRMSFEGAPTWFRIDKTLPGVGIVGCGAAAQVGDAIYALSESGFIRIRNGTTFDPIGVGRVDEFIREDLDDNFSYRISALADPSSKKIFWAYPGPGNTAGRPNRIIVYDYLMDRWGLIHLEVELLWRAGGVGYTLEGLDAISANLDTLTPSLDSSAWKGQGTKILAAFGSASTHGFFDGVPMTATIETKELEIYAGRNARVTGFTPLVDGGTVTARVGTRQRQSDSVTFSSVLSQTASGRFTPRTNARFHRFELECSGAWKDAIGVEVDDNDAKVAERRG